MQLHEAGVNCAGAVFSKEVKTVKMLVIGRDTGPDKAVLC